MAVDASFRTAVRTRVLAELFVLVGPVNSLAISKE
jgi:hypothetical protein